MNPILSNLKKEDCYKFLFEGTSSGVCLTTPNGQILDCNDKFVEIIKSENYNDAIKININNYFTDSYKKPFSFPTSKIENSQHYLYLTSEKKSDSLFLVTIKSAELQKELFFFS